MASRKARAPPPQPSRSTAAVSIPDALSKLGMTHEQFQEKQAELLEVLLQSRPFVPQTSNARYIPLYEKVKFGHLQGGRSRSSSLSSSSSSRAPSPALSRTPAGVDRSAPSSRPRDQMELVLEERNRRKESQRRGSSTSRSRESERVFPSHHHATSSVTTTDSHILPTTPHHYRYYSERVVGEASSSKLATNDTDTGDQLETPSRGRGRGNFKVPEPRYPRTPRREIGSSCSVTPRSSPPPVVNLVSSPGPMRPDPPGDDQLPYVLPPEPYSEAKPDLSYAAIIGQAILSSQQHALALQDIYEYITTVYPYYKRGEATWMNSVRHALSTMAVFRKMQRGRAEGKSLWAIYDCDIPCFDGGGFKKTLCADMNHGPRQSKKRNAEDSGNPRKRKKAREGNSTLTPAPILPPFFPPFPSANPHHQPYYQAACMKPQTQVPAEILFPPLPPSSNFHRALARTSNSSTIPSLTTPAESGEASEEEVIIPSSSPIERPPSSSSLPDLISSISTSSSPSPSSRHSLHDAVSRSPSPEATSLPGMDPIAEWLSSDSPLRDISPPIPQLPSKDKGKTRASPRSSERRYPRMMAPMLPPSSPTPRRRGLASSTHDVPTPMTAGFAKKHSTTKSVAEVIRALEHAIEVGDQPPSSTTTVSPRLTEVRERTSTPIRFTTPPPPSTPSRYGCPSTPSRHENPSTPSRYDHLDKLEAELFDFSPHANGSTGCRQSPSLSIFTTHSSGSMDALLPSGFTPSKTRSRAAMPKTPKKTPNRTATGVVSPFGTPSRVTREHAAEFEDDFAQYFDSPRNIYDRMAASLSGMADLSGLESPSSSW